MLFDGPQILRLANALHMTPVCPLGFLMLFCVLQEMLLALNLSRFIVGPARVTWLAH